MRLLNGILRTAAAVAILSSSAQAASLFTAPAPANVPVPQILYCDIANASTHNVTVGIEIYDSSSVLLNNSGDLTLVPSEASALGDFTSTGAYCKFTVRGGKKLVRALAVYNIGAQYTIAIPAE